MSLLPGEERTLSAIEDRLRKTDLWLAVKFTLFAGLAFCRRGPIRELVSPWQSSRRRTQRAILAVLLLALAFCAVMALLTGGVI